MCLIHKSNLIVQRIFPKRLPQNLLDKCEFICVDFFNDRSKIRFCCIYIPPSSSRCNVTISLICDMLSNLLQTDLPFFLFGDFNLPKVDWTIPISLGDPAHDSFLSFSVQHSLTQHINEPTHKKGNTLDLLFCNIRANSLLLSSSVQQRLSSTCDHDLVCFFVDTPPSYTCTSQTKELFNFVKADYTSINSFLQSINWFVL